MLRTRTVAPVLCAWGLVTLATTTRPAPVTARSAGAGGVERFDLQTFGRLDTLSAGTASDEFGTLVSEGFLVTAPGAQGGGRLFLVDDDGAVEDSKSATELSTTETERLGESFADLGHPPGTASALVVGAPGESAQARGRLATPAAVIVEYDVGNTVRFRDEVRRIEGPAGSLFGWRVGATDNRFPEASFNGAILVSAPREDRGRRRGAGAVYKFDTETGARIWKREGGRAGEFFGYAMVIVADRDGDGFSDVFVGAPGTRDGGTPGRVYLLSGATGAVIDRLEAPPGAELFGYEVANGSSLSALPGLLVSAPATDKGKKANAGAVYHYEDLGSEPNPFLGKRREQWFGVSLATTGTHLLVGSFEGHKKANKDRRGSVTVLLPGGRAVRTLRGKNGGDHFGRALSIGRVLAVGVPGSAPLFVPE